MARKPKSAPDKPESPQPTAENLSAMLEKSKAAIERGVAMLDACVAKVSEMLKEGTYDSKLASHLAWVLDKQANAMADLRRFGERVKTQSLELTPEQQRRAVMKFVQQQPATVRAEMRAYLDADITDIELLG